MTGTNTTGQKMNEKKTKTTKTTPRTPDELERGQPGLDFKFKLCAATRELALNIGNEAAEKMYITGTKLSLK
jgi:hypothetical protein